VDICIENGFLGAEQTPQNMSLKLIESSPYPGEFNMAVDVLLTGRVADTGIPHLRFYRWSEPTVSVGSSVPASSAFGAAVMYPGSNLCKRPTDGGIVYHGDQMSFSLIWPLDFPRFRDLRESYFTIHQFVQRALTEFGIESTQASESDPDGGILCSASIVAGDLLADQGTKLLGGALWRSAGAVLYQGHLWLKWMPMLEEAIAFALADMMGLQMEASPLIQSDLDAATEESAKWRLQIG